MYILTSKYFPTDSWPDDYFPALPEGVVDIQYKEVVEFSLAIAATAEFEVVLPNDEFINVTGTDIIVSGAGTSAVNGTYVYYITENGKPRYLSGGGVWLGWTLDSKWSIDAVFFTYYTSVDDVATPDLVTTWSVSTDGIAPIPTVTALITPTLTEVAPFTVEMPTVVEMEVYEELSA